jgi:hypothetical protein
MRVVPGIFQVPSNTPGSARPRAPWFFLFVDQTLELKTAEYVAFAKRAYLVMRKTRIRSPRQPGGLDRTNRKDHKFALASITLLAFLLIAGLSGWIFKNSSIAAVHPGSEVQAAPL